MMQTPTFEHMPHFWLLEEPPYFSNVWLFKTNHLRGHGEFVSRQRYPSGITLRIITAGKWVVKMSGQEHHLGYGDIFLALPGVYIEFGHHDSNANWEWYELQFNGNAAGEFIREFGVDESHPATRAKNLVEAIQGFKALHQMMGSQERTTSAIMDLVFRLTQLCGTPLSTAEEKKKAASEDLVIRAITLLETNPASDLNVNEMAQRLGVDRTTLGRAFKNHGNETPHDFLDAYRLIKVKELLENTAMTIAQIAHASGFRDEKYFISWFRRQTGKTPGKWRNRNA